MRIQSLHFEEAVFYEIPVYIQFHKLLVSNTIDLPRKWHTDSGAADQL